MEKEDIHIHTLSNGIRLVHLNERSDVAYLGFVVGTGTRDENDSEQGMAHLVEHMLFKGTTHRKAWHILNRLDSVGGELNAYTTKEETYVYATMLKNDFERAVELMSDILFHSTFPESELEKEVEVVLDEINSYEDSPSELIYDDMENLLFENQPIGRNILGSKKSLLKHDSAALRRFVDENYRNSEIVFYSIGDVRFEKIVRWAEKYMLSHFRTEAKSRKPTEGNCRLQEKRMKKRTHQCHYMAGSRAYSLHQERERLTLYLLNNILGGPGMNSCLNVSLRERNGLAYTIESNMVSYSDTGLWSVYFGCDKQNEQRCKDLMTKELRRVCETPFTMQQLQKMKRQIFGQMAIAAENKENLIQSIGKSILYFDRYAGMKETVELLESISADDIQRVAKEIIMPERLTTLVYG